MFTKFIRPVLRLIWGVITFPIWMIGDICVVIGREFKKLGKLFKSVLALLGGMWQAGVELEELVRKSLRDWKGRGYRVPPMTFDKVIILFILLLMIAFTIGIIFLTEEITRGDWLFGIPD